MKKFVVAGVSALGLLALSACGTPQNATQQAAENNMEAMADNLEAMSDNMEGAAAQNMEDRADAMEDAADNAADGNLAVANQQATNAM